MAELQQQLLQALKEASQPLSAAELSKALTLPKHLKNRVIKHLEFLAQEGKIQKNARRRYSVDQISGSGKKSSKAAMQGRFMLSARGSAFVRVEGRAEDYMVPARYRGWALPDDEVQIKPLPRRDFKRRGGPKVLRRDAAEVLRVIKRGREQWAGRYRKQGGEHWLEVTLGEMEIELDIEAPEEKIKAGEWIVVSAPGLDQASKDPAPGKILSRLGGDNTPNLDTMIIVKQAGIPEEFSNACLDEAAAYGSDVPKDALEKRLDLRDQVVFTIDGADARDFDDAVSIMPTAAGWTLGVHIADVSEYVVRDSELDKDAIKRGTSTYLPDHVVPMLPEALSNGLCSLNENVDRLTLSAIMEISKEGVLGAAKFHRSVIKSSRRCTYEEVEGFLFDGKVLDGELGSQVGDALKQMQKAALLRLEQRNKRGALDFNFPETRCELDSKGMPTRLFRASRLFAHQLIEEFMLAANESVARALRKNGTEFLYRIHEEPDTEKLSNTLNILARLKVGLKGMDRKHPAPKEIQKLLATVAGTASERTAQTLILRSLRLARYAPEGLGHYGLALEDYSHFTSPIRRYPDLHVHRLVKRFLCENKVHSKSEKIESEKGSVEALGLHCSTLERRAEKVERQCIKAKQMRYLESRVGESYQATVTSVGAFGYFAEINDFPAEGLVRMGSLVDDLYSFDEDHWCLRGLNRGRQVKISDTVQIVIERADWESLQADFIPAPEK